MTDPDLNEWIALRKEWHQRVTEDALWESPDQEDMDLYKAPPDYKGKWEHAGPLLVELIRADQKSEGDEIHLGSDWLTINEVMYEAEENVYGTPNWPNSGLTEAIAHAWKAWKEAEDSQEEGT